MSRFCVEVNFGVIAPSAYWVGQSEQETVSGSSSWSGFEKVLRERKLPSWNRACSELMWRI